jgi:sugar phosphate isomerase/epimerase
VKQSQIAAQLFTVRDFCKTAPDFAESMKKIRAIGYTAVQVSGVGPIPEDEIVRICTGEGLTICATHEGGAAICDETQKVIDRLGKLGTKYTAYPWPHTNPKTEADTLALAAALDKAGAKLRAAGQVLCYHNHAIEFRKVGAPGREKTMLDVLYDETDPRNLQGEPDVYWVQAGGGDPVDWCTRLHRRLPLIHLKDYGVRDGNQATMMEIGAGCLNWRAIVAAAERSGCEWFIVEQDTCPGDPFASLTQSWKYVSSVLAEK